MKNTILRLNLVTAFFYTSLITGSSTVSASTSQLKGIMGTPAFLFPITQRIAEYLEPDSAANFSATNKKHREVMSFQIDQMLGSKKQYNSVDCFGSPATMFSDACARLYGYPREDFIAAALSLPKGMNYIGVLHRLENPKNSLPTVLIDQLTALKDIELNRAFLLFLLLTNNFSGLSQDQTLKLVSLNLHDLYLSGYIRTRPVSTQSLTLLGELGCIDIQDYVAKSLANETEGFTRDFTELRRLADLGWKNAQSYIAEWFFRSNSTNFMDEDVRNRLGSLGWKKSRGVSFSANATGSYAASISSTGDRPVFFGGQDIKRDPIEGRRLADLNWENARYYVAEGITFGIYGFTQDLDELRKLAHQGWEKAQDLFAEGLAEGIYGFTQDLDELKRIAVELGWKKARDLLAEGLAEGIYGFEQNPTELRRLAVELGWKKAQELFLKGITEGTYGFVPNPNELKQFANLGWENAPELLLKGISEGRYGFQKDHDQLRTLDNMDWNKLTFDTVWGIASDTNEFDKNQDLLRALANLGCQQAQKLIICGVAFGVNGFDKDIDDLKKLTDIGWEGAREQLASVIDGDIYEGDTINPKKLKAIADSGCQYTQNILITRMTLGSNGFTQDIDEVRNLLEKYGVGHSFETLLRKDYKLAILGLNTLLAKKSSADTASEG